MTLQQMTMQTTVQDNMQIRSSLLPPPYLPSTARSDDLTPISIKQLSWKLTIVVDTFLSYRWVRPNRMTAIMAIVEDQEKDAIVLQLYQQPNDNVRPAKSVITHGDVFLIKEPYFKVMGDGDYGLRVDHISDVVRIDAKRRLCPEAWRTSMQSPGKKCRWLETEGQRSYQRRAILERDWMVASNPSPLFM